MTEYRCDKCRTVTEAGKECEICGAVFCPDCFEHHAISELEAAQDGQYDVEAATRNAQVTPEPAK